MDEFISILFSLKRVDVLGCLRQSTINTSIVLAKNVFCARGFDVPFFIIEPSTVPNGVSIDVMAVFGFDSVTLPVCVRAVIKGPPCHIGSKLGKPDCVNHVLEDVLPSGFLVGDYVFQPLIQSDGDFSLKNAILGGGVEPFVIRGMPHLFRKGI